jgi:putative Mg2+ transporter-C (MgtC) family protein
VDLPSSEVIALRILLAAAIGLAIGVERELSDHPAGMRTHIGVALGSCLFGVMSAYGFAQFDASRDETNFQVDPTRVASNIVVGIGFLGGGTILKHGLSVRGLTTAASMWVTAAAGLGCALGMYSATLVGTGVMLASLVLLRAPRRWLKARLRVRETVVVELKKGAGAGAVIDELGSIEGVTVRSLSVRRIDDRVRVEADVQADPGVDLEPKLAALAGVKGVADIDVS